MSLIRRKKLLKGQNKNSIESVIISRLDNYIRFSTIEQPKEYIKVSSIQDVVDLELYYNYLLSKEVSNEFINQLFNYFICYFDWYFIERVNELLFLKEYTDSNNSNEIQRDYEALNKKNYSIFQEYLSTHYYMGFSSIYSYIKDTLLYIKKIYDPLLLRLDWMIDFIDNNLR